MLGWAERAQYAGLAAAAASYAVIGRLVDRRWAAFARQSSGGVPPPA
jgi:hypothetical protein